MPIKDCIEASPGRTHWQKPGVDEIWYGYAGLCGVRLLGSLSTCIDDEDYQFCVDCKSCQRMLKKERMGSG